MSHMHKSKIVILGVFAHAILFFFFFPDNVRTNNGGIIPNHTCHQKQFKYSAATLFIRVSGCCRLYKYLHISLGVLKLA